MFLVCHVTDLKFCVRENVITGSFAKVMLDELSLEFKVQSLA
jgi:hypothetical protein